MKPSTARMPGALGAFLRGIERRAAVFSALQCGDVQVGDAALAATCRAFTQVAGGIPMAEWPRRFWMLLLAQPALRASERPMRLDGALALLDGLGSGPRAVLLLQLVAGLDEADMAAVLGISPETCRLAQQRALPRLDDGSLDVELWLAMRQESQQAIRELPDERLRRLSVPDGGVPRRRAAQAAGHTRWMWPSFLAVLLLTLAALAATWHLPLPWAGSEGVDGVRIESLPDTTVAALADDDTRLLTHRDLDLLLDDEAGAVPVDPAFDAWLAVAMQADDSGDADLAAPETMPEGMVEGVHEPR